MARHLNSLGFLILFTFLSFSVSAQQTLEEATDSIKNILSQAKNGDAFSQNEVGGWYYRGRHVKQNYEEALKWWSKSAQQGNVLAIGNMGLCYQTGNGIAPDSLRASKLYLRSIKEGNKALLDQNLELAKKGNVFSNMLIAECYRKGYGVGKNISQAIPFLKEAAERNCVAAQRDLALILLNGKKAGEALPWFKKGSENGDPACTFYYGKMLMEGLGIKADKKEGANYILKAAEKNFPQSMFYLGNCYMNGEGITKNAEQAVKWYRLAAGKGSHNAEWKLAECYREGIGTPINYEQALFWYGRASEKSHARAFKSLVSDSIPESPFIAYMKGMKGYYAKDFDEALKQFKIVDKAKVIDGKIMTAAILANPSYSGQNIKKGVKLFKESAKISAQAMYLLGALYEAGVGVDKNMDEAVDLITKAADSDYAEAECALADIYFEGRGVEQNYKKAVELYAKAYAQGQLTENAAKRYASCYADGKGDLTVDKDKAQEILSSYHRNPVLALLKAI